MCWSNFGFFFFSALRATRKQTLPSGTLLWEVKVNVTRTYPLWLSPEDVARLHSVLILQHTASMVVATAVPTVSGVRYRSEDQIEILASPSKRRIIVNGQTNYRCEKKTSEIGLCGKEHQKISDP
jgi:hypothetical protein